MSNIPSEKDARIRAAANNQCGYCRMPQHINPSLLEIEHLRPKADGGSDDDENLWLACRNCNNHKSDKTHAEDPITKEVVRLFNPRSDNWSEHFEFVDDVYIQGITAIGRTTVSALSLNLHHAVEVRKNWRSVGWYPPRS